MGILAKQDLVIKSICELLWWRIVLMVTKLSWKVNRPQYEFRRRPCTSEAGSWIKKNRPTYPCLIFLGTKLKYPIGSMYGIYANIGGILMVNVTIYSIHGSYGYVETNKQRNWDMWIQSSNFLVMSLLGLCFQTYLHKRHLMPTILWGYAIYMFGYGEKLNSWCQMVDMFVFERWFERTPQPTMMFQCWLLLIYHWL